MSFSGLHIGASGLSASQKGVDVAGHNAANVNSPSYTRQRVEQAASIPARGSTALVGDGMKGTGVTVTNLSRLRDNFADASWRSQSAVTAEASATAEILNRVEALIGSLDSGLPKMVNNFFSAWSDLTISPTDPAARQAILSAGHVVTNELGNIASQLNAIGPDSTSKAVDLVAEANILIEHVAGLNVEIANAYATNQAPNDLLDNRDNAIDKLSALLGARVGVAEDNGHVAVFLEGQPLVRGKLAYPLSVTTSPAGPVVSFSNGSVANPGGQVGGLIKTATEVVPSILAGFDQWTADFMNAVNTVHASGFGVDGSTGTPFFSGTGASDIAVTATVASIAASSGGLAADGNNALALMKIQDNRGPSGTTIGDELRGMFSSIGLSNKQAQLIAASSSQSSATLELARQSVHAVSVDEEMVDMVRYQRAYEAAARVITVADELLDTLINRTAR